MTDQPADSAPEGMPTPHADSAPARPALGIKDAAKACGVHEDTVRRAYRRGLFPNSTKGAGGAVIIPITDLLAAGYRLNAPTPGEAPAPTPAPRAETKALEDMDRAEMAALREMTKRLEVENARLVADLAKIEAREAQLLDLMGLQLKALNAGTASERPQGWLKRRRGRADSAGA